MAKAKKTKTSQKRRYRYVPEKMLKAWVALYKAGKSLGVIGKKYDRNASVVRGALLRARVKLRARGATKAAKRAKH